MVRYVLFDLNHVLNVTAQLNHTLWLELASMRTRAPLLNVLPNYLLLGLVASKRPYILDLLSGRLTLGSCPLTL